jgi:hypothetical protein
MSIQKSKEVKTPSQLAVIARDSLGSFFNETGYCYPDNTPSHMYRCVQLAAIRPSYALLICKELLIKDGREVSQQSQQHIIELLDCQICSCDMISSEHLIAVNYLINQLASAKDKALSHRIYLSYLLPICAYVHSKCEDKGLIEDLQFKIDLIVEKLRSLTYSIVMNKQIDLAVRYGVIASSLQFFPTQDRTDNADFVRNFEYQCRATIGVGYWQSEFNKEKSAKNATRLFLSLIMASSNTHDLPHLRANCRQLVANFPSIMDDPEALQWQDTLSRN